MRIRVWFLALIVAVLAPGCVLVQVGVTNPIPGLSTVAVAPFINLSAERATDGRRFALAYASELQKVPGFEVIPVGVTEVAMVDGKIDLNDPDEVLKLARILRVDAVVVGAITEYSPYYPPRIGMEVNWYSPRAWSFYPGIQTEPAARGQLKQWDRKRREDWRAYHKQLEDQCAPETPVWQRMYQSFKRLPGIRTLYGEPTLVRNAETMPPLWRAQSPSNGNSTGDSPTDDDGEQLVNPAGGTPQSPVKVAHYQDFQGVPTHVRQVTTRDNSDAQLPTAQGPVPLPALPNGAEIPLNGSPAEPSDPSDNGGQPAPQSDANGPETGDQPPASAYPEERTHLVPRPLPTPSAQQPPDATARDAATPNGLQPESRPMPETDMRRFSAVRGPAPPPCPAQPNPYNLPQPIQPWQTDPRLPLMSYTRIFDGSDGNLVAAIRDYVELNGDLRSGGWEAYLHRSDDFIRFTAYRMILEMLSLHGGEGRHRTILKFRRYNYPFGTN